MLKQAKISKKTYMDVNNNVCEIQIKESIPFTQQALVCEQIASIVLDDEDGETSYMPYYFDYAFYVTVLQYYSDFFENGKNDLDPDVLMSLLRDNEFPKVLDMTVDANEIKHIKEWSHNLIDAKKNKSQFEYLCSDLRKMLKKYDQTISNYLGQDTIETLNQAIQSLSLAFDKEDKPHPVS